MGQMVSASARVLHYCFQINRPGSASAGAQAGPASACRVRVAAIWLRLCPAAFSGWTLAPGRARTSFRLGSNSVVQAIGFDPKRHPIWSAATVQRSPDLHRRPFPTSGRSHLRLGSHIEQRPHEAHSTCFCFILFSNCCVPFGILDWGSQRCRHGVAAISFWSGKSTGRPRRDIAMTKIAPIPEGSRRFSPINATLNPSSEPVSVIRSRPQSRQVV